MKKAISWELLEQGWLICLEEKTGKGSGAGSAQKLDVKGKVKRIRTMANENLQGKH